MTGLPRVDSVGRPRPARLLPRVQVALLPLAPVELAEMFARTGTVGDAQRAVMVAPYDSRGWMAFADCLEAR